MSGYSLALVILALAAFAALALGMAKHWQQMRRDPLSVARRRSLRVAGWILLAGALAVGIAGWGKSIGIVAWLGWLSVAGLALVFCLPKLARERGGRGRRRSEPQTALTSFAAQGASMRLSQKLAAIAVVAVPVLFAWRLQAGETRPLSREDALRGEVGPWSFALAETDRGPPELVAMQIPVKAYQLRFCDACDREIRHAYLKVNQPRSLHAAGIAFEGPRHERSTSIQMPSTLRAESELWLTVVGRDGSVHQTSWRMDAVSPATVEWFERRRST